MKQKYKKRRSNNYSQKVYGYAKSLVRQNRVGDNPLQLLIQPQDS